MNYGKYVVNVHASTVTIYEREEGKAEAKTLEVKSLKNASEAKAYAEGFEKAKRDAGDSVTMLML